MRRKGVMHITAAGSTVISVNRITICMGTLRLPPFFPADMPSRERGSALAAIAGPIVEKTAAKPNSTRGILIVRPPALLQLGVQLRRTKNSAPARSRWATKPAGAPFGPPEPDAAFVAAPVAAFPDFQAAGRRPSCQLPAWRTRAASTPIVARKG